MSPERWEQVCALFAEAGALPAEDRGPLAGGHFAAAANKAVLHQMLDLIRISGRQVDIDLRQTVFPGAENVTPGPPDVAPIERKT